MTTSHAVTSIVYMCIFQVLSVLYFYFIKLHHKGRVTAKAYANTVLPNSPSQLSLWGKTGVPGGNQIKQIIN